MKLQIKGRQGGFGGISGYHNKDAEWLEDFRHVISDTQQQEKIEIAVEKVRKMAQKIPNWKASGPDMVQGYQFKNSEVCTFV